MSDNSKRGVGLDQAHLQLSLPGIQAPDGSTSPPITLSAGYRSSALPSPEELAGYEHIVPGGADRILRMAERQLAHEHHVSKINLWISKIAELFGIAVTGFFVVLTTGGAFALLWRGNGLAAAKVFLAGVGTVAIAAGLNRIIASKSSSETRPTVPAKIENPAE